MYFGTFLDRDGHFIDTVHFPPIAVKYPFRGKGIYAITGKVLEEFGCINIEVVSLYKLPIIEDPRYAINTANRQQQKNYPKLSIRKPVFAK